MGTRKNFFCVFQTFFALFFIDFLVKREKMKLFLTLIGLLAIGFVRAEDDIGTADDSIDMHSDGTDDDVAEKSEEAISLDGFSAEETRIMRESAEHNNFEAEVNRMMKLIINSLYKNKDIFLRELISNASDALDKIRLSSLTDEKSIKIKVEKEANVIHITDTGLGMTSEHLKKNLGTIAKSGTSEFYEKRSVSGNEDSASDLIGQFGVGFYSAFLVADKVVVTSKHNDDEQYVWESDSESFTIAKDPRGDTLKRGTTVSLYLKEEAGDYLQHQSVKDLIQKYSQFINFPIYLWGSSQVEEEVPIEEEADEEVQAEDEDEEGKVEDETDEEEKPKTQKVTKTVWDWELINSMKPIWQRKTSEIEEEEYESFYKAISKDSTTPMTKTHFSAEGEVSFKAILFVPKAAERDMFNDYGQKKTDNIKMYVRRVFITDDFTDMMPKYLQFVRGVVDSDDLPLNVSRETLQQHKLLKVIKKKLVRKALDMIKKIDAEEYTTTFWKEYSTNIKLGVIEDHSNRTRLAKLLRFHTSKDGGEGFSSLEDYVERMKEGQEKIFFCAGASMDEVKSSPFSESLLKKGYELIYLIEPVDEYTIQALPEFDGKRFQNVAKEGVELSHNANFKEKMDAEFEDLCKRLKDHALLDKIEKAEVSMVLDKSPAALLASSYGWSGNMQRIMEAQAYQTGNDASSKYYATQKKTFGINPRHPLIKTLKEKVELDSTDDAAMEIAKLLFDQATIRSGFKLSDPVEFADRIMNIMYANMDIDPETPVEDEPVADATEYPEEEIIDMEEEIEEDSDGV